MKQVSFNRAKVSCHFTTVTLLVAFECIFFHSRCFVKRTKVTLLVNVFIISSHTSRYPHLQYLFYWFLVSLEATKKSDNRKKGWSVSFLNSTYWRKKHHKCFFMIFFINIDSLWCHLAFWNLIENHTIWLNVKFFEQTFTISNFLIDAAKIWKKKIKEKVSIRCNDQTLVNIQNWTFSFAL